MSATRSTPSAAAPSGATAAPAPSGPVEAGRPFRGRRAVTTAVLSIEAGPDAVFPLLCPVREAEWLDGWVGRPVYAESGLAEENGVYATDHAGESEPTIWLVTKRDPVAREIELVYLVAGRQAVRLALRVEPAGEAGSRVHVRYVRTGLTETGNREIEESTTPTRFGESMKQWETAMNHYFVTGRKLTAHG